MIKNFNELNEMSGKCSSCLSAKFAGADGKRHVVLCGGTGCLSSNSNEITEEFKRLIEEKGLSNKVTVNQVGCFGFCSQGPFVKIYPEDTLYRLVKVEDVKTIVEKDIIGGEVIEELLYVDPTTAEKITKQEDINFYKKQVRVSLHGCGSINPESIEESLGAGAFAGCTALKEITLPGTVFLFTAHILRANFPKSCSRERKSRDMLILHTVISALILWLTGTVKEMITAVKS